MTTRSKALSIAAASSLAVGLIAGLWFQYQDAYVVLEVTVVSDHDDTFHFYSDHGGDRWVKDEWSRPLKADVPTKLYMKFHKGGIRRFKFEPLRKSGTIRFVSIRFTDRIDQPLRPFPIEKISPKKDISLESAPGELPLVFSVPEGAKDPQIYVTKAGDWEFSTRRDLWDSRLLKRGLRIALVSFLLLAPISLISLRKENHENHTD